jgi:alpha-mannosidase
MEILGAESTNLFIGSESAPRQVVRLRLRGNEPLDARGPARVRIQGDRLRTEEAVAVGPLGPGQEARLEVGIVLDGGLGGTDRPGERRGESLAGQSLPAEVVIEDGPQTTRHPIDIVVAEPGWRMFMVSHFHYDPVWWNTQAAYTETWGTAIQYRSPFQEPGLALVKAHLEMARRDPIYKFVLAELDYLKPYWDVYPEDRAYIRQLLADGRLELMGGTYNEPNTNLTSAESTIRNALYGVGYQRDVLGGAPASAWQLDAFGHDPQFPGIMADAGITSSSWARGPFHEWGPHWVRGPGRLPFAEMAAGEHPRMQFETEFDWISPSGGSLLTCFMANHYSAGWWMDSAATLEDAEAEVHRLFSELAELAATKNVLLPVGTDYTPPNKWLTAIHRDWSRRYVWPKFIAAIPSEFFAAVREERARTGRRFSPQTRDMNPIYTGKDVSFIDTKQAQRSAENTLLSAEKFATIAGLLGARFPSEAIDKAWRQLLFGAHHDGITGSESDQVYLDLIGGWREAQELGGATLAAALDHIGSQIDTTGDGVALTVFNQLSWSRTDIVRAQVEPAGAGSAGIELRDDAGGQVPFVVEAADRRDDGTIARATIAFLARDVPSLGYRSYRVRPSAAPLAEAGWRDAAATTIENEVYRVTVDPERGGAIVSLVDRRTGKELVRPGEVANELRAYREYPNHPLFGEGPWHLTPDGRSSSSVDYPVEITTEESSIGRRIRLEGPFDESRRSQDIVLWDGLDRVELTTRIDDYRGQDRLFRVRVAAAVDGGAPVSEVGNAVVGRGFGFPNVDVAKVPFTLDNPAYNWFALGATARVVLVDGDEAEMTAHASHAIGVAEVVTPGVTPDLPQQDEAVRGLVVALVRQGVTATTSTHDGPRYGVLHIDSNLPDVRIAIGRPADNRFVASVLDAVGPDHGAELERQLAARGWARLWIPAISMDGPMPDRIPDRRGVRDLPVLVVAGVDAEATRRAIEALAADLDDATIAVEQPAELDPAGGVLEDYTIGMLNRGMPGFNVERGGDLYLSLLRSCSGWPSGVWIDPPRRATPDGSNFQFQHWSHVFEYALAGTSGDWRGGPDQTGLVRAGHEYNNRLIARTFEPHPGPLPAAASFIDVEPSSVVLTALKPAGNPLARLADAEVDPRRGLVMRLYEACGWATQATIHTFWPLGQAEITNATEDAARALRAAGEGAVEVPLAPCEIVTVRAMPSGVAATTGPAPELVPRIEPAQPVFSGYWLHNKGAAPTGYQPVTVQIRPWLQTGGGPFRLPVVVASERTDGPVAGTVTLIAPPGWTVEPAERPFRLAPGAHLEMECSVTPAPGATPGRYFVAARIGDDAGGSHEDVVTIDYAPTGSDGGRPADIDVGSRPLALAIDRALRTAGLEPDVAGAPAGSTVGSAGRASDGQAETEPGGELVAEVLTTSLALAAGEKGQLRVSLRNLAASEIRGEAQLLSPHETWPVITPWTQGFTVGPGATEILTFAVEPPYDFPGGTYWALVKVMYFGRLCYTESIPVELLATSASGALSVARR